MSCMLKRPNILIINPDQMRADALHHLQNEASVTPNLDKLAWIDGVSFRNAYCQNPVCTPSRCSFTTGLYPHVHGHRTMNHMIHDWETTIFRELKDAGYYVWLNDRNDLLPAQEEGYYDKHADYVFRKSGGVFFHKLDAGVSNPRGEYGDKDYYSFYRGKITPYTDSYKTYDDESVEAAVSYINGRKAEDGQPFCLFLGLNYPHPPYQVEEPYFSKIDRSKLPPRVPNIPFDENTPSILKTIRKEQNIHDYSETEWDELRACYLGMCMKVDEQVGMLCEALKNANIYDDTAIFFFSDHGDFTGDYGITEKCQNTFQDCLTNVPLLIKPPKGVEMQAGICGSMVELVDFYATAMDFAGVVPNHTQFGRSLKTVLADHHKEVRKFVTCEGGRLAEENHCSEVPTGLPELDYEYRPRMVAQANPDSHTKATMLRTKDFKYVNRLYEADELYDLQKDPKETKNVIHIPEYRDIAVEMRKAMLDWYQETCDVVPFQEDARFPIKEAWKRIRTSGKLPIEKVAEIDGRIAEGTFSGTDFQSVIAQIR